MRFSLKWLLVLVAYVAVVCASIVYASTFWIDLVALASIGGFCTAVVGAVYAHGRIRAFFGSFAIAWLIFRVATFSQFAALADFRSASDRWGERVASIRTSRETAIRKQVAARLDPGATLGELVQVKELAGESLKVEFLVLLKGRSAEHFEAFVVPASQFRGLVGARDLQALGKQHLLIAASAFAGFAGAIFWSTPSTPETASTRRRKDA